MQQPNKIEFEARPVEVSVQCGLRSPRYADITLKGNKDATIGLSLSESEMKIMFNENIYTMDNRYKITIENITEPPKAHELLQIAATSAKLGNSKLAVEQAIKALKELVK